MMTAKTDPLTTMPNRDALDSVLKQIIDVNRPVALAMLDIDLLSEVNSRYGHTVGDHILAIVANFLTETAPGGAFRTGGDEFVLIMPDLSLEQAFLKMEILRARVAAATPDFNLPNDHTITISIGVAQYPRDAKTARALLQAADVALGTIKESGRNQVGLPLNEEMVMKSCYYPSTSLRKLRALGDRHGRNDSSLLREALDDLFRKYDLPREG